MCLNSGSGNVKALLVAGDQILSAHGNNNIRIWRRSGSHPNAHIRVGTLPKLNIFYNFIRPLVTDHGTGRVKHSGSVTCLAYNATDDLLCSGSADKSVKVWNVSEGKCIETIEAHNEAVNAVVVRHDGLLFTRSDDSTVNVWRRPSRGRVQHKLVMTLNMQRCPVKALALGPHDSAILMEAHGGPVKCIAVTALDLHENSFIAYSGSLDGMVKVWMGRMKTTMDSRPTSPLRIS
eukprot:PITA_07917